MNNEIDRNTNADKVYIAVLIQSLEQKNIVLEALLKQTKLQEELLKKDILDEDLFNNAINEKRKLLNKLQQMDDGFQQIYDKMSEKLKSNPQAYAKQIETMKQLISQITQKGTCIEAIEHRNKERFDSYLFNERKRIREYTVNSKTVANYYKNMSKITGNETFFVDKKS